MTEQEDRASGLLPPGEYQAKLVQVDIKYTQKNNEMWNMRFHIDRPGGSKTKPYSVFGNVIPDHDSNYCRRMFRHLCYAAGREQQYEAGTVDPAHLEGCHLIVRVIHEPDDGGKLWPRVDDFLMEFSDQQPKQSAPATADRPWDNQIDQATTPATDKFDDNTVPF